MSSALAGGHDLIVARATPAGRGALAVVRLSGSDLAQTARQVCPGLDMVRGWRAQLVAVHGPDGERLDRAVAIPYRAPRSYTGEDMLELVVHGSPFLVSTLIEACVAAGARQAEPGEFTRRAVANGRMDLLQAEAVRELVAAETAWQLRNARRQLEGGLSRRVGELRELLVRLLAEVEAGLDFADQVVMPDLCRLEEERRRCLVGLEALLRTAAAGTRIREGLRVVILGQVNAGKSTLFNYLAGRERAIVSPLPGTTRDVIEAEVERDGVRMVLVDTAGIRETEDAVELEGVRRALAALADAQAAIVLWPAGSAVPPAIPDVIPVLRVRSKADLSPLEAADDWLPVSVVTGAGVDELEARLRAMVAVNPDELGDEVAIARRHRRALERAAEEVRTLSFAEPELAAEDLRWALRELGELIGQVSGEEILDEVFRTFCVGK